MKQLYTIGYAAILPTTLARIAAKLKATVIDCRVKPVSRKPGFGSVQLQKLLGPRYQLHGHHLGGRGFTTPDGIQFIRQSLSEGRNLLLLCLEEAPGDCHRHQTICAPHFPREGWHIYGKELILAGELERSITQDNEYSYEDFAA